MVCSIDDCEKPAHARGWCPMHYVRWRTTGRLDRKPFVPQPCSVDACPKPHFSKGWCITHYQRVTRIGSTELPPRPSLIERLTSGVVIAESGCWIWQGKPAAVGYGRLSVGNRLQYAHRVSYEVHVGPIPDGLSIDHLCRVRLCINPDHLEPVTLAENTRRQMAALRSTA